MPAIRKLPDTTTLRRLRAQGHTQKEIAEAYGASESAVFKALQRAGYTDPMHTYRDVLPWKVEEEHKATAVMEKFRTIVKQRKGVELRQDEAMQLQRWLDDLSENGLVVNYHPKAPANSASSKGGFYYVPRTADDDWIIRRPAAH